MPSIQPGAIPIGASETKKPLEISSNGFGVSCEMCGPCFSTRQYIRGRTKNEGLERFNL